ncbi:MAG: hypothetical protein GY790_09400 [Bacteroidetes bacterium]|nr:hypothetical protein [Bacteroidota bacterium]
MRRNGNWQTDFRTDSRIISCENRPGCPDDENRKGGTLLDEHLFALMKKGWEQSRLS